MARIAGVDIPRDKRVEVALTYIYGIGPTRARTILSQTGVNPDTRVKDLEDGDIQKLRGATEGFTIEGDLRRQEGMALKRLQDIGCVRPSPPHEPSGSRSAHSHQCPHPSRRS